MKPLPFDEKQQTLFEDIMHAEVPAKLNAPPARGDFPCILYHHGAQSTPFDNVQFCEYMASNGYVVISSNYLWPQANNVYLSESERIPDIQFMVSATEKISSKKTPYIIGVGHSWGAQALIAFDTLASKPFKKIISFHTTLEDKSLERSMEMWEDLMRVFRTQNALMTTPTFLFAPDYRLKNGFNFITFKENKTTPYTFITTKTKYITHDGFISLGNMRAPFAEKYKLADGYEIMMQNQMYLKILQLSKVLCEFKEYDDGKIALLFGDNFEFQYFNKK